MSTISSRNTVPGILAQIAGHKRAELRPVSRDMEEAARASIAGRRSFARALTAAPPAIIAEIKKASPSQGLFVTEFDPISISRSYQRGGAAALSVLTDQRYFQGSLEDLQAARGAGSLPVLRKDFTIAEFHVIEAAANGADAILLIAALLDVAELRRFRELAAEFHMDALVEVHNRGEVESAIDSGAAIVGVNNRDLHTFEVRLETALELAPRIPSGAIRVAESGIRSSADVRRLRDAGYDAFLVGEHLMRSGDPAGALWELRT